MPNNLLALRNKQLIAKDFNCSCKLKEELTFITGFPTSLIVLAYQTQCLCWATKPVLMKYSLSAKRIIEMQVLRKTRSVENTSWVFRNFKGVC